MRGALYLPYDKQILCPPGCFLEKYHGRIPASCDLVNNIERCGDADTVFVWWEVLLFASRYEPITFRLQRGPVLILVYGAPVRREDQQSVIGQCFEQGGHPGPERSVGICVKNDKAKTMSNLPLASKSLGFARDKTAFTPICSHKKTQLLLALSDACARLARRGRWGKIPLNFRVGRHSNGPAGFQTAGLSRAGKRPRPTRAEKAETASAWTPIRVHLITY
jgi:hypothetical protein